MISKPYLSFTFLLESKISAQQKQYYSIQFEISKILPSEQLH